MVFVDLSRLRRGKTHNKAEKLDMFNKYCCSLFVKKRCDVFIVHVQKRSAIVNREGVEQRLGSGRSIFQPARTDGALGGVLQGMDGCWVSLFFFSFSLLGILRTFQKNWQMLLVYHLNPTSVWGWWSKGAHEGSIGKEAMGIANHLSSFFGRSGGGTCRVLSWWSVLVLGSIWLHQLLVASCSCEAGAPMARCCLPCGSGARGTLGPIWGALVRSVVGFVRWEIRSRGGALGMGKTEKEQRSQSRL